MIRNMVRLQRGDIGLCVLLMTGFFLAVQAVIGAVMLLRKPEEGILISQWILLFAAGIVTMVLTMCNCSYNFTNVLRFGRTRREALLGTLGLSGLEGLACLTLAMGYTYLERTVCTGLWRVLAGKTAVAIVRSGTQWSGVPEREGTLLVEDFSMIPWWAFVLIVLGCLVLGLITGSVLQRFGNRGTWAFVAVCWLPSICMNLFPRLEGMLLQARIAAGLAVLAGIAWSLWSLLHAVVRT